MPLTSRFSEQEYDLMCNFLLFYNYFYLSHWIATSEDRIVVALLQGNGRNGFWKKQIIFKYTATIKNVFDTDMFESYLV